MDNLEVENFIGEKFSITNKYYDERIKTLLNKIRPPWQRFIDGSEHDLIRRRWNKYGRPCDRKTMDKITCMVRKINYPFMTANLSLINGVLVLEPRKTIPTKKESWNYAELGPPAFD